VLGGEADDHAARGRSERARSAGFEIEAAGLDPTDLCARERPTRKACSAAKPTTTPPEEGASAPGARDSKSRPQASIRQTSVRGSD
jgi:hypothetical protein